MEKKPHTIGKCIIFSAPSGSGKTTIVHSLLKRMNQLSFSISASSRTPRNYEVNGKDYYFLTVEEFKQKINENAFIEWQEVYKDHFYGTLKEEVERLWKNEKIVLFDVDVYGGINLKKYFGNAALSIFVEPPSIEELERRLRNRQTETEETIKIRLQKAKEEVLRRNDFDKIIINQDLDFTVDEVEKIIKEYLKK